MVSRVSTEEERPLKRTRQACEPCRRKKSRCPGEKPACSYCERLGQNCVYTGFDAVEHGPGSSKKVLEQRMSGIEEKLEQLMDYISRPASATPPVPSAVPGHNPTRSGMPPQEEVSLDVSPETSDSQLYLTFCNSQPLLLFPCRSSLASLGTRDSEVTLAMEAMGARFRSQGVQDNRVQEDIRRKTDRACQIVMMRLASGTVELSTLQTLCILSMLEFTAGHIIRSGSYTGLAIHFIRNLRIRGVESWSNLENERDERKLCYISLIMLRNLQGSSQPLHTKARLNSLSELCGLDMLMKQTSSGQESALGTSNDIKPDIGFSGTSIYTSALWAMACNYATSHVGVDAHSPWSPKSDYSMMNFYHCEHESLIPLRFRLHASRIQDKSPAELQAHRDYWGPWLFFQMIWHAVPCLINHPFLLSLRLRKFRRTMPQSFLRNSFEQLTFHSGWVIHFIDLTNAKDFEISDPTIGHCVAIVATIYLQHSFVEDEAFNKKAQAGFEKCLKFLRNMGRRWPHINRQVGQLERLRDSVYHGGLMTDKSTTEGSHSRQKWSVNLQLLWKILVYAHASSTSDLASDIFGPGLAKDSVGHPGDPSAGTIAERDFYFIGSAGMWGHQTVASECVTYPPDQIDESTQPTTLNSPTIDLSGLPGEPNFELPANDALFLQLQDYGRAFEDWLSINPT